MIKFIPSFVGSKARWISRLKDYHGYNFIELFAGSSVLSANLANYAILNDNDPYLYKYYLNYQDLPVISTFTKDDYFHCRLEYDWYMFIYYLQKMSFSGVYRWSKNGYNVPIKKNMNKIQISNELEQAKLRFQQLNPQISCLPYNEVDLPNLSEWIVVLDPPYEKSKADYNKHDFDYHIYWEFVNKIFHKAKVTIVFDTVGNMPFTSIQTRKMVVNGKYKGDTEAMFIFDTQKKFGKIGEVHIAEHDPIVAKGWKQSEGYISDFVNIKTGDRMELKTDCYDMNKTPNFFMERWSDYDNKDNGGPWQAVINKSNYYMYYFVKNGYYFVFNTQQLIGRLDLIVPKLSPIFVMNSSWKTVGYKINRELLNDLIIHTGTIDV